MLHKPNLLILDEPTNGLDPEGIKELRDLIKNLAKTEKMGILISSHNLAELESFCNKVTIIKNGKVVETNDINEVKKVKQSYIIEIDDLSNVEEILKMRIEPMNDNKFRLHIKKSEAPQVVKRLVENNKKVYMVTEEILTLEDAFLKKTGGNVID